jgi:hypothetical protein
MQLNGYGDEIERPNPPSSGEFERAATDFDRLNRVPENTVERLLLQCSANPGIVDESKG